MKNKGCKVAGVAEKSLKERKREEARRDWEIATYLAGTKKLHKAQRRERKNRKKSASELLAMLDIADIRHCKLAAADGYLPKSHNLDRQLRGLIDHMFVRYTVPDFLYDACIKPPEAAANTQTTAQRACVATTERKDPFARNRWLYREWFLALAQGGSFRKLVKGFMTGREAVLFLKAPNGRFVHENVWWAKLTAADIPAALIHILIERVFRTRSFEDSDGRLAELVLFFSRFHGEMDRRTVDEIVDCVVWKLNNEPTFRLKGRTVGSMVKLSNEWHALMQKAKLGQHIAWRGLGLPDWDLEVRDILWTVTELRDNKDLLSEGQKMRHCVYSYVSACTQGRSAIFSLRKYTKIANHYTDDGFPVWEKSPITEQSRATIEVSGSRVIVQARSKANAAITVDERKVMKMWAGEKALQIAAHIQAA